MNNNSKYNKSEYLRLVLATADHVSSDKEKAIEFLSNEGFEINSLVKDGMNRLKRMKMQIEAERTKEEMILAEETKERALDWVESLLSKIDFSLPEFIKRAELTMNFRNIENLSKEDIKNILVKHFTLKFLEEQSNKKNDF